MLANLLLLAAARRRKEIALRQAEGARRPDIFAQFVWEGLVLAAVGITLGVLLGMLLAKIRVALDPNTLLSTEWPWLSIAKGAAILLVGSLLASVWPAWSASRHAPVELIRRSAGKARIGGRGILRNPARSALLTTTYAFGFASVLAAVATIEGGRKNIKEDAVNLGVDVIAALNPIKISPLPFSPETPKVDRPAIAAVEDELGDSVRAVIPIQMNLALIQHESAMVTTTSMTTSPDFEGVLRSGLLAGRFLDETDEMSPDSDAPIPVVLDEALAREFDAESPEALVGQTLRIVRGFSSRPLTVVGVFNDPISLRKHVETFDSQASARDLFARRLEFRNIYLPWNDGLDPSGVLVQLHDEADVEAIAPRLESVLSARGIEPFYHVQRTWVDFIIEIVDRFRSLSSFIWAVDLLMVIVLTATISLLAVSERYPEVALRRAEGASRRQVVVPLLVEATWLGVLSIPFGLALGVGIIQFAIRPILDWPPYLPPLALWGTPATVIVSAWLSHAIPAFRIARLDPAPVLARTSGS